MCTPSRASLMTGKYESQVGMNHFVIASPQPYGLPLSEKILPQYLQEAGYSTELIGKWHLGFHKKAYTPTKRGFHNHFGYIGPYIDYYEHDLNFVSTITSSDYFLHFFINVSCFGKTLIVCTLLSCIVYLPTDFVMQLFDLDENKWIKQLALYLFTCLFLKKIQILWRKRKYFSWIILVNNDLIHKWFVKMVAYVCSINLLYI